MGSFEIECVWDALPGAPPPKVHCFHIHPDGSKHKCDSTEIENGQGVECCCVCGEKGKVLFKKSEQTKK